MRPSLRCGVMLLTALAVRPVAPQGVRVRGTTWVQLVDARPFVLDSARAAACDTAPCTSFGSGPRETVVPIWQDLSVAAWGLGQGISAHAQVRLRSDLGNARALWPRSDDHLDLLYAYVDVQRERAQARLGRQFTTGPLGVYNFDGVSALVRRGAHAVDVWGGAALVQGLNEGYLGTALGSVNDLPPDERAWLVGARARLRFPDRLSLAASWQRTFRNDRGGVYADRVALAGTGRVAGVELDGAWTQDLVAAVVNEARLGARFACLAWRCEAAVRRSRPYFEWWTIWGAFAPAAFDEARGRVAFGAPGRRMSAGVSGAYRAYTGSSTGPLAFGSGARERGWRVAADGSLAVREHLTLAGTFGTEIGPGASQSDGGLSLAWSPTPRVTWNAAASAVTSVYEYRLGTGRLLGAQGGVEMQLTERIRLAADAGWWHHDRTATAPGVDWGQRRGTLRLEWSAGREPGERRAQRAPGTR